MPVCDVLSDCAELLLSDSRQLSSFCLSSADRKLLLKVDRTTWRRWQLCQRPRNCSLNSRRLNLAQSLAQDNKLCWLHQPYQDARYCTTDIAWKGSRRWHWIWAASDVQDWILCGHQHTILTLIRFATAMVHKTKQMRCRCFRQRWNLLGIVLSEGAIEAVEPHKFLYSFERCERRPILQNSYLPTACHNFFFSL